jgi:hypothetical protein
MENIVLEGWMEFRALFWDGFGSLSRKRMVIGGRFSSLLDLDRERRSGVQNVLKEASVQLLVPFQTHLEFHIRPPSGCLMEMRPSSANGCTGWSGIKSVERRFARAGRRVLLRPYSRKAGAGHKTRSGCARMWTGRSFHGEGDLPSGSPALLPGEIDLIRI